MKTKSKCYVFAAVLAAVFTMLFASPTEITAAELPNKLVKEVCLGYNSYEQPEEAKVYYFKNSHGDIIGQVDENGNLLASYSYNALGELVAAVTFAPETASTNRFLYAGEQYDTVSGLYYLRARHYDAGAGHFTQEDTYLGDGRNLYAYTHSNPLKYTDPSGHASYDYLDSGDDIRDDWQEKASGGVSSPQTSKATMCQGYSSKGYFPQSGERMLNNYVKSNVKDEVSLKTQSSGFNNNKGTIGGVFRRYGSSTHGGISPHVHQSQRNVSLSGEIYGKIGTKTSNGGVTYPTPKDVKQLYQYITYGKYK